MDWRDKTVVITGGTGSFGKALTRVLLETEDVRAIRIVSRDEFKQYDMQRRLRDDRLRFLIGDVRDRDRLMRAFDGADVVIHAAALKQVPACEYNPFEAVKTNVIGASNVIDAAIEREVERVIALSTDKAANPINLYGATKLCAEKLFVQGNAYSGQHRTRFGCVRYGNVVASRGSIIPLILEQRASGKITLTDPRMTRFWITLSQAVRFVHDCVARLEGGEIFIPKIPSVRILDLISALAPRCTTEVIGIRPGEKIHEVLVTEDESRHTSEHDTYFRVEPEHPWWPTESGERSSGEFVYSSDRNTVWLDPAAILAALPGALNDAGLGSLEVVAD